MTTHTDRIRQMAQEADAYAHTLYQMRGEIWHKARDERFAQLVAEDCADIVDNADTPDCGGWSACGIADDIRARYSLKD